MEYAALRRHFFEDENDDEQPAEPPPYDYLMRTSLQEAWRQGFDIFFAACVLNSPRIENVFAETDEARRNRSVDLDRVFALAASAVASGRTMPWQDEPRGGGSPLAVAAGLWRAARVIPPGVLISARALLDRNPHPTEADVRAALVGNLCRCTGYVRIVRGVLAAAEQA